MARQHRLQLQQPVLPRLLPQRLAVQLPQVRQLRVLVLQRPNRLVLVFLLQLLQPRPAARHQRRQPSLPRPVHQQVRQLRLAAPRQLNRLRRLSLLQLLQLRRVLQPALLKLPRLLLRLAHLRRRLVAVHQQPKLQVHHFQRQPALLLPAHRPQLLNQRVQAVLLRLHPLRLRLLQPRARVRQPLSLLQPARQQHHHRPVQANLPRLPVRQVLRRPQLPVRLRLLKLHLLPAQHLPLRPLRVVRLQQLSQPLLPCQLAPLRQRLVLRHLPVNLLLPRFRLLLAQPLPVARLQLLNQRVQVYQLQLHRLQLLHRLARAKQLRPPAQPALRQQQPVLQHRLLSPPQLLVRLLPVLLQLAVRPRPPNRPVQPVLPRLPARQLHHQLVQPSQLRLPFLLRPLQPQRVLVPRLLSPPQPLHRLAQARQQPVVQLR